MGGKKRVRPARKPPPKAPLSGRIKKASLEQKKLAREFKRLEREGRIANGVVIIRTESSSFQLFAVSQKTVPVHSQSRQTHSICRDPRVHWDEPSPILLSH